MNTKINSQDLKNEAEKSADDFLNAFIKVYLKEKEDYPKDFTTTLNSYQQTVLAYYYFREEMLYGGFLQLIQNGFGTYIFKGPFAKMLKEFGLRDLSRNVYSAHTLYEKDKEELEKEHTDEEFMALYDDYSEFEPLDDDFLENEKKYNKLMAEYIDNNIEFFIE